PLSLATHPRRTNSNHELRNDDAGADEDGSPGARSHGHNARDLRQQGRVCQMKEDRAAGEDDERSIARELPQRAGRLIGMAYGFAAMRLLWIDLFGTDAAERKERWGAQSYRDEENCPIRDQISAGAHPD